MSKYNDIKSIKISTIPQDEISQAIKEWSMNNPYLEKILWACFNNKIETSGCHISNTFSYLDIKVNDSHDMIKKMLHATENINNINVILTLDHGNPFSGDGWDEPSIGFHLLNQKNIKSVELLFDKLSNSLNSKTPLNSTDFKLFEYILDFHDYFKDLLSGLDFNFSYKENKYIFSIDSYDKGKNLEFLTNLFKNSGLNKVDTLKDLPFDRWELVSASPKEFDDKMEKCKNTILNRLERTTI